MSVEIIYKDISLTAKADSTPATADKQSFVDLNQLKESGLEFAKYATCEDDFVLLDGTFEDFPDSPSEANLGLWSNSMTDSEGNFVVPPELTINFSNYETSVGITLQFNPATDDYCNSLNIKWYQDDTLLADENYGPNSALYFCQKNVTNFNKVVITFSSMNNPYRFLKLQAIEYGVVRTFGQDELRSAKILEEVSLTGEELSINTLDFNLDSADDTEFMFQKKQPLTVKFNSNLMGTYFIDKAVRKSARQYDIEAIDYAGLLDKIYFSGGIYSNRLASTLISEIIGSIPYELDSTLGSKTVSGTLEKCTCREALQQVAFAIGGVVDTSRSNIVKIFTVSPTIKSTITKENIYIGADFEADDEITEIRVIQSDGTVVSRKNPVITSGSLENILEFQGVFINTNNSGDIANRLYDYYVTNKNNQSNMKFKVANEAVSDVIEYETEYLGTKKGQILSMNYGLNSNKIVADVEIKELEAS